MTKTPKSITLEWRDENYGRVHSAVAFRADVEPFPSDTEHDKLARIYKKHGFEVNHSRAAWIAEGADEGMPAKFTEALQAAGYEVEHSGNVPASLRQASAPGM